MINIRDVTFKYKSSDRTVLNNFSLDIADGEFILLLGESGCGKTTVTRLINGLIPHFFKGDFSGDVFIDGVDPFDVTLHELSKNVGSVFQDPRSQFFATDTTAEIAFSCENYGMKQSEIIEKIMQTSDDLNIQNLLEKSVFEISSGEKQIIAIASVYAFSPKILVFDEPSANLDHTATLRFGKILKSLKEKGYTIIISEHRIHYLKELADRSIVIKNGTIKKQFSKEQFNALTNDEANRNGLRSVSLAMLKHEKSCIEQEKELLSLKNVSFSYKKQKPLLKNITFNANEGQIIGIIGKNGMGKSTFLELVCGLKKKAGGKIKIAGKSMNPKQRIKTSYLVMQDSDYQLFTESVESELKLGNKNTDMAILKTMDLANYLNYHPASLSGGQKQRLCIAVAFADDAKIVCFDEPSSGLDYKRMRDIASLMKQMAERKKTLLVVTHDLELLLSACSHILHLENGIVSEYFEINENEVERIINLLN